MVQRRLEPEFLSARAKRLIGISANLVGAAGAALFAKATLQAYLHTHRLLGGAFVVEQMWIVVAYLIRRPARTVSRRLGDWLLAFGGTFAPLLFRPVGAHPHWGVIGGLSLQVIGVASASCPSSPLAARSGSLLRIEGWYDVARMPSSAIPSMPLTSCFSPATCCRAFQGGMPSCCCL